MENNLNTRRLYGDLAWLWPIWGSPDEYTDYCEHVLRLISEHSQISVRSLLNIGCGGGKNAFNLKRHYEVTGVDLSPQMLALAKELNPDCNFLQGDMRTFSLTKTFDAVVIDDGISYMTSRDDLTSAFRVACQHLAPGGIMVVTADDTKETFRQNRTVATPAACASKPENLEVVFIENDYDPDSTDDCYEGTMVYLIREDGNLRVETDHHILGLFPLEVWRESITRVGFKIHEEKYTENDREYVTFACLRTD